MSGKNYKFWLDDDSEWKALSARLNKQTNHRQTQEVARPQRSDTINNRQKPVKKTKLTVNLILSKLSKFTRKQIIMAAIGVSLVVGLGTYKLVTVLGAKTNSDNGDLLETSLQPTFKTLFPNGNKEETSSRKITYNPEQKVASYTDKIGHVDIVVNQESLPKDLQNDTDRKVEKLAESINATEVINESSPKAYLSSSDTGPQTAVFHKKGLLVFIHSSGELDREIWAAYVTRLL